MPRVARLHERWCIRQIEGVRFMWSCCVESLKALLEDGQPGYGCVLAHSMGAAPCSTHRGV